MVKSETFQSRLGEFAVSWLIEQPVKTPHSCGEVAVPAQVFEDTGPLVGRGARDAVSEKESVLVGLLEIGAHRDTSLFDRIM